MIDKFGEHRCGEQPWVFLRYIKARPLVPWPQCEGRGEPSVEKTILVIEDDKMVQWVVVAHLEEMGFRVLCAGDGWEALAILTSDDGSVDLLLTDVVLTGGMNGLEVAEQARLLRPGLSVLFMSGYS